MAAGAGGGGIPVLLGLLVDKIGLSHAFLALTLSYGRVVYLGWVTSVEQNPQAVSANVA